LTEAAESVFGSPLPEGFELHAADLRNGKGLFKGMPVDDRLALQRDWFRVASDLGLKVVYRSIEKMRFEVWVRANFGNRGKLDPFLAAFPLVAQVVDQAVGDEDAEPQGPDEEHVPGNAILIADDNAGVAPDVEAAARLLRGDAGALSLSHVIEKVFFIDSRKSLPLQLCDLCALAARKKAERESGVPPRSIDDQGIKLLEPLVSKADERLSDVLRWLRDRGTAGA